jgi:hypothetical protein
MRQWLRSHLTYVKRSVRRRHAFVLVTTGAALAIGGIASASHISNVSSLPVWKVTPGALPGPGGTPPFANVQLEVQAHTNYAHPSDAAQGGVLQTITVLFDDDVKINLAGIPPCTATFSSGATIAQAWERCGPGADQPGEVNAYLSPATGVSGTASTAPPSNFPACTLVFKRSSNPDRLLLFLRLFGTPNGTPDCASPATNTAGSRSGAFVGSLANAGVADFGRKLTAPVFGTFGGCCTFAWDDFYFKLKRASAFQARCRDANKLLGLRGRFVYSGSGQPADTVNKQFGCT